MRPQHIRLTFIKNTQERESRVQNSRKMAKDGCAENSLAEHSLHTATGQGVMSCSHSLGQEED